MRSPGDSYPWALPLVMLAAITENASLSRIWKTACVRAPAVAGETGTSVMRMDSGPSARLSSTMSTTSEPDVPETTNVVAQLKSAPRCAVPLVGPENRTWTVALPEYARFTGIVTVATPSSPTTRALPKATAT